MRLDNAIRLFIASTHNPATRRSYMQTLRELESQIGGGRPLVNVESAHIIELIQALHVRRLAPATIHRHIKTIKAFFNWCIHLEYLEKSPAAPVKNRRPQTYIERDKAMSDDELAAIISYVRWKPRDHALVLFVADTGCRAAGAAGLRLADLDLDKQQAYVIEKGNKRRPVWFGNRCTRAFRVWLIKRRGDRGEYVFMMDGKKMQADNVSTIIRRACKAVGIRSLGAHSLRHRKGHALADARVAPSVAATALGHERVLTTMEHYYPADYDSAEAAIRELVTPDNTRKPTNVVKLPQRKNG